MPPPRVVIAAVASRVVFASAHHTRMRRGRLHMGHMALANHLSVVSRAEPLGPWWSVTAFHEAFFGEPIMLLLFRQKTAVRPQLLVMPGADPLDMGYAAAPWGPAFLFAHAIFFGLRRRPRALRSSVDRGP